MHAIQIFSLAYRASWETTSVCGGIRKVSCVASFPISEIPFIGSVNLTADGKRALLKLSKGDMRRALNILQACHAAYDIVGETEIYSCTGNPHPSDIEIIVNSMLADEFTTSYQSKSSYHNKTVYFTISQRFPNWRRSVVLHFRIYLREHMST